MDIFVGSIPFKLTEAGLRELFEKHGEVSAVKIVIDKATRQNKGFGFVTMPNEPEAKSAIKALHDAELNGRKIVVNVSEKTSDNKPQREKKSPPRDWHKKGKGGKNDIITWG